MSKGQKRALLVLGALVAGLLAFQFVLGNLYLVQVYFSWWRIGHVFTGNISIFLALVYIGLSMAAITYLIPTRQ